MKNRRCVKRRWTTAEDGMGDREKGLYRKFDVRRVDGTDAPGQKHHGCRYYVLDLDHDPHALPALRAYAESCERGYPALAFDLRAVADGNGPLALCAKEGQ